MYFPIEKPFFSLFCQETNLWGLNLKPLIDNHYHPIFSAQPQVPGPACAAVNNGPLTLGPKVHLASLLEDNSHLCDIRAL